MNVVPSLVGWFEWCHFSCSWYFLYRGKQRKL